MCDKGNDMLNDGRMFLNLTSPLHFPRRAARSRPVSL